MDIAIELLVSSLILILTLFIIISRSKTSKSKKNSAPVPQGPEIKVYPLIGSYLSFLENIDRRIQWTTEILQKSPSATYKLHGVLGRHLIFTGYPANVQHILKTHFHIYEKGDEFRRTLYDFLGTGIFNSDGESWKFQRQVSSHEFNTKSLRKFIETVVDTELSQRLIPILSTAAATKTALNLQDVLQRFAFDNICKISFGYDPAYLSPSLPRQQFADAFEEAVKVSEERFSAMHPAAWKIKRFLGIGSERRLKKAVTKVWDLAVNIIEEKREEFKKNTSLESVDLLSRFLSSGLSDEEFIVNVVINFILAGRDTTSAVLTWFFWLLHSHPTVENEIVKEIREKSDMPIFEEVKDMVYTHASLCESMRLYPPAPTITKVATSDDVLPDGTPVKKGTPVTYHIYAMGRLESLWGSDWADFKPERWLRRDEANQKWNFVAKDPYTYPVFQAGPRICLGKEMAFLQMKRVVAGVLSKFKVVPVMEEGTDPVYTVYLTAKMKGGFPVRIEKRTEENLVF